MPKNSEKFFTFLKKIFVYGCIIYAISRHFLVAIILKNQGYFTGSAVIAMGLTLIVVWVVIGGFIQKKLLHTYYQKLTKPTRSPVIYFVIFATILACLEEAVTVTITNLAQVYGVPFGQAYITASANYLDVITMHSVIMFVPMFITLGLLLKRYDISPFKTLIMWGIIGVLAEALSGGIQALSSFTSWIFIYGLMVYIPAHIFVNTTRKKPFFLLYPVFIIMILFSAITTVWIPNALDHPQIHFPPITLTN